MLLCSGLGLVVFIICATLYYLDLSKDLALCSFNFNLWKQYQNYGSIVHKFPCLCTVSHKQMMDTVRINEIHLWLNKVRTDINFNLVISRQKQISFTHKLETATR